MLTLNQAQRIIRGALAEAGTRGLKPLAVVVLDERGSVKASAVQDGASLLRERIAHGKAYGALALGIGSRALHKRAEEQAYFIGAANAIAGGALVPVPGGVLVKGKRGVVGAVGISGDASDNDEAAALAGIAATGLEAEAG